MEQERRWGHSSTSGLLLEKLHWMLPNHGKQDLNLVYCLREERLSAVLNPVGPARDLWPTGRGRGRVDSR